MEYPEHTMPTTPTPPKRITITLSDRAPVRVDPTLWPLIARVDRHDGEVACQANTEWSLRVRRHDDGRCLIYGWEHAGNGGRGAGYESAEAGEMLAAGADLPSAIRRVGERCRCMILIDAVIADLPPEDLE